MRKRTYLLSLLATCVIALHTQAQDKGIEPSPRYLSTQKKYTFAVQPFQWLNWGLRFDYEVRLGDGPGWLQFGPTIYTVKKNERHYYDGNNYWDRDYWINFREPFAKLTGGGLDVNYKRFFDPKRSLYYAGGLSYTRFNIDYNGGMGKWHNYTEDGLLYHEYQLKQGIHTQHIDRMAVNAYFGYQIPARHAFLFDMFTGISYRHATSDKDKPAFNDGVMSYGYTGYVFMLGVRLGIGVK